MNAVIEWLAKPIGGIAPDLVVAEPSLRSLQVQLGIVRASLEGLDRDYRLAAMLSVGSPDDTAAQDAVADARQALQAARDRAQDLEAAIAHMTQAERDSAAQETAAALTAKKARVAADLAAHLKSRDHALRAMAGHAESMVRQWENAKVAMRLAKQASPMSVGSGVLMTLDELREAVETELYRLQGLADPIATAQVNYVGGVPGARCRDRRHTYDAVGLEPLAERAAKATAVIMKKLGSK